MYLFDLDSCCCYYYRPQITGVMSPCSVCSCVKTLFGGPAYLDGTPQASVCITRRSCSGVDSGSAGPAETQVSVFPAAFQVMPRLLVCGPQLEEQGSKQLTVNITFLGGGSTVSRISVPVSGKGYDIVE